MICVYIYICIQLSHSDPTQQISNPHEKIQVSGLAENPSAALLAAGAQEPSGVSRNGDGPIAGWFLSENLMKI